MIESGNAQECSARFPNGEPNGWFVGGSNFIPSGTLRQSDEIEIKWNEFSCGFDSGIKPCSKLWTISILFSGSYSILYRRTPGDSWIEHSMKKPGDFIIAFGDGEHIARAHENSVLVTCRITTGTTSHFVEKSGG